MTEPTELERRCAVALARLYTDDARAEKRAEHLIEHVRVVLAEYLVWQAIQTHVIPTLEPKSPGDAP